MLLALPSECDFQQVGIQPDRGDLLQRFYAAVQRQLHRTAIGPASRVMPASWQPRSTMTRTCTSYCADQAHVLNKEPMMTVPRRCSTIIPFVLL